MMRTHRSTLLAPLSLGVWCVATTLTAQDEPPQFATQRLTDVFHCEGAAIGDLDGDGHTDIVAGPYWYAGPSFEARRALYAPRPFPKGGYSDNFLTWVHDIDGDGDRDVLVAGWPGKAAVWFANPGHATVTTTEQPWPRHVAFDVVDNESPAFVDLTGDGHPELVCQFEGRLGYLVVPPSKPTAAWHWHPLSGPGMGGRYTHGLGVGDLDGDGRADVVAKGGWWRQPEDLTGDPEWQHHAVSFAGRGGAQMLVFDVDGDGDHDVVSSDDAHGYGLYWFEQQPDADGIRFHRHQILTPTGGAEMTIGNLHALASADVDGDGLSDLVTGNRYWAHGGRDPADRDPPVLCWLQLSRNDGSVQWRRHLIHDDSGVGTQVVVGDVNGDGRADVVVGNKKGAFVHRQTTR